MHDSIMPAARGRGLVRVFSFLAAMVGAVTRFFLVPGVARRTVLAAGVALRPVVPAAVFGTVFFLPDLAFAGANPWGDGVEAVCSAFFGPIGKGLAIVAVVVGGLMFAFGEGGSKSAIAGLVFGAGMVLGAAQFLDWLGIIGSNIGGGTTIEC